MATKPQTPARAAVRLPLPPKQPPRMINPASRGHGARAVRSTNVPSARQPDQRLLRNDNGNPGTSDRLAIRQPLPWSGEAEVGFYVRDAPPNFSTKDFYNLMQPFGNLVFIELIDSRKEGRAAAEVKFRPPPQKSDWFVNGIDVTRNDNAYHITFEKREFRPYLHPSPVNSRVKFPEEIKVTAVEVSFGVLQTPASMQNLKSVRASTSAPIDLVMNIHRKCLDINFSMATNGGSGVLQRNYKVRFSFAQMKEVIQMQNNTAGQVALIFTVDLPPQVFRKTNNILGTHDEGATMWTDRQTWFRQTQIREDMEAAKHAVTQLQPEMPVIHIGRWLTYCLVFNRSSQDSWSFQQLCLALQHHDLGVVQDRMIVSVSDDNTASWSWLDNTDIVLRQTSAASDLHQLAQEVVHFEFDIRYQLEVCASHGMIHETNIDKAFLEKLAKLDAVRALKLLEKAADEKTRFWNPNDIFRKLLSKVSVVPKRLPSYCAIVRSAVVTPTTIYFSTPVMETSNRVVRQYSRYADRFLRVKFTDELYKGSIRSSDDVTMNEVFTRIKRTMVNGIVAGGRHYEFLAFGNSQFREGGAWFFAPTSDVTPQSIRDWMGDFTDIKVIAKYCSRVGQCFSTTRAMQIGEVQVTIIPDIERNGHNFTDGVGKISSFLAQMIATQYGLPNPAEYPSMFQFRLGGSKGVLTVDPSLIRKSVHIRPSQEKFPSKHHADLNICRISQFSTSNLNVQIILVLSALGVDDNVFLQKMNHELRDLREALHNSDKAIELLCKNVDYNQYTLQLASMVEAGFMDAQDPFTISCMHLWHSWTVKYLKEKARIPIHNGAFVLGCVDETATLKGHQLATEGLPQRNVDILPEIFIQVPNPGRKGHWKIITGVCTLARNPSLHPGDVRVVRAVDVPQLHHLRNCVVLPQLGDRDLASMCSGGDLDGDDYLVMWDEDLLPTEWNHPPMNYDPPEKNVAPGPVTVDDMTSFFVNHLKHDNLPQIAVAHKYHADRLPEGVKSAACLELAQLHSKAVDYAKTGVSAEFPKHLRVRLYPHWAELKNGGKRRTYQSNKVIGKLYDMVNRVTFQPAWEMPFDKRILEAFELDEAVLDAARVEKLEYDTAVHRIMAKFGMKSDFEVFTTFALEHSDDFGDYKFAETLGEVIGAVKDHHQKLCYEKAGTTTQERDWEKMGPFVAAMYTVTAQEVEAAVAECKKLKLVGGRQVPVKQMKLQTMPFMSFPWLFANELARIARKIGPSRPDLTTHTIFKPPKKMPVLDLGDDFELEPLQEVSFPMAPATTRIMPLLPAAPSDTRILGTSTDLSDLTSSEDRPIGPSPRKNTSQSAFTTSQASTSELTEVSSSSSSSTSLSGGADLLELIAPEAEAVPLATAPAANPVAKTTTSCNPKPLIVNDFHQPGTNNFLIDISATTSTATDPSFTNLIHCPGTADLALLSEPLIRAQTSIPPPHESSESFSRTAASPPSSGSTIRTTTDGSEEESDEEQGERVVVRLDSQLSPFDRLEALISS